LDSHFVGSEPGTRCTLNAATSSYRDTGAPLKVSAETPRDIEAA